MPGFNISREFMRTIGGCVEITNPDFSCILEALERKQRWWTSSCLPSFRYVRGWTIRPRKYPWELLSKDSATMGRWISGSRRAHVWSRMEHRDHLVGQAPKESRWRRYALLPGISRDLWKPHGDLLGDCEVQRSAPQTWKGNRQFPRRTNPTVRPRPSILRAIWTFYIAIQCGLPPNEPCENQYWTNEFPEFHFERRM